MVSGSFAQSWSYFAVLVLAAVFPGAARGDVVLCEACVAIATDMCKASLDHAAEIDAYIAATSKKTGYRSAEETAAAKTDDPLAVHPVLHDGGGPPPMSAVMDAAYERACAPLLLSKYRFPLSKLEPKCSEMKERFHREITEFFAVFHRKGLNCARGVDVLCAYVTEVCRKYDTEEILVHGVATTAYRGPVVPSEENPNVDL